MQSKLHWSKLHVQEMQCHFKDMDAHFFVEVECVYMIGQNLCGGFVSLLNTWMQMFSEDTHWLISADSAEPHDVPILLYCLFLVPNHDSDMCVGCILQLFAD